MTLCIALDFVCYCRGPSISLDDDDDDASDTENGYGGGTAASSACVDKQKTRTQVCSFLGGSSQLLCCA